MLIYIRGGQILVTKNQNFGSGGVSGTETLEMACTWLGKISSSSCLTALPGPAWVQSCLARFKNLFRAFRTLLASRITIPFSGNLASL